MKFLLLPLLLIAKTSFGQTFFVVGKDIKSVEHVTNKVKFEGHKIASDSTSADYIIELLMDGSYKFVSLKQPYQGYVKITDRRTGQEVTKSKIVKGGPTAFNGYNAAFGIYRKIADKYLPGELKKCKEVTL
ncbi:hypothetical protein AAHN97_15200 [Chitinophaga niabensis]|uniref:hypothetical protein n=1 Tax=Chitinophaga niabensis TaxID=536979 RepID=UPI0031BAB707